MFNLKKREENKNDIESICRRFVRNHELTHCLVGTKKKLKFNEIKFFFDHTRKIKIK